MNQPYRHWFGARDEDKRQSGGMKRFLALLLRLTDRNQKPPLHTAAELECFKRDALENRGKHY